MAEPLVTVADLETRLGRTLTTTAENDQAKAYIADASALVREIAEDDFLNDDTGSLEVPPVIVPVVVSMVRRGINNPMGRSSEDFGDASWQGMGSIYATKREKAIIRQASPTTGLPGAGEITLDSYLPLRPHVGRGSDLLGS